MATSHLQLNYALDRQQAPLTQRLRPAPGSLQSHLLVTESVAGELTQPSRNRIRHAEEARRDCEGKCHPRDRRPAGSEDAVQRPLRWCRAWRLQGAELTTDEHGRGSTSVPALPTGRVATAAALATAALAAATSL